MIEKAQSDLATCQGKLMKVTFVVPARNFAGGLRTTVELANKLLSRGHAVRIAYRRRRWKLRSVTRLATLVRESMVGESDWIGRFGGEKAPFRRLSQVSFDPGEIVVAVGSFTTKDVYELPAKVTKLRYCRGLPTDRPGLMDSVWRLPMPTITVSELLNPVVKDLIGQDVLGVVPNGIKTDEYFTEDRRRDGIGGIYIPGQVKAGEVLHEVVALAHKRWGIPVYLFGPGPKPKGAPWMNYRRLPSVARARELYNRSKVWILPSRREGLPAPILEAMACGSAVISTEFPTAPTLIQHNVNGMLVPIDDVDEFLKCIEMLLSDEDLRMRMVQKGFETVRNHSWEAAADRMEHCLRALIHQNT